MANNKEIQFVHKGCGGALYVVDVNTYEYYGGDVKNKEIEFKCRKCEKSLTWEDNETDGFGW